MVKLEKYVVDILTSGFPELSTITILASYHKMPDAFFEFTRKSRYSYRIDVDKSLKNKNSEIIIGGMAHEIAHISREVKMNPIMSFMDQILYEHFGWYEQLDERNTDLLVVQRGFGQQLLAFLKYADSKREDYNSKDGLTVTELEAILRGTTKY